MSHELIDQRSLELHREVVRLLRENPALLDVARQNLNRWLVRNASGDSLVACYQEWLEILDTRTLDEICDLLTTDSEEARRLRQNTPFTGILKPSVVRDIKRRFHHAAH